MNYLLAMAPAPGQGGGSDGLISTIIMFAAIFAIFYFMIIRPQQKRQKEKQKMIDNMQVGDEVLTSSGIYGKINRIEDKIIILDVDDKVKMKFDKAAVGAVITKK
ncbi:MAG: preprotein translocase subunit YajC [Chlorobiaceae bacterium]|nr:preprotein translocase subunit YajC [Chlorobiaceae bacterium]MBA4310424.1 preprotein translocase subunit YajC [Chlorobiaceae bacterium]